MQTIIDMDGLLKRVFSPQPDYVAEAKLRVQEISRLGYARRNSNSNGKTNDHNSHNGHNGHHRTYIGPLVPSENLTSVLKVLLPHGYEGVTVKEPTAQWVHTYHAKIFGNGYQKPRARSEVSIELGKILDQSDRELKYKR